MSTKPESSEPDETTSPTDRRISQPESSERDEREIVERSRDAWKRQVAKLAVALDTEQGKLAVVEANRAVDFENYRNYTAENAKLKQQLSDERKSTERACALASKHLDRCFELEKQLLAAQEAIKKCYIKWMPNETDWKNYGTANTYYICAQELMRAVGNLSALEEHDAEVRKPLVDALNIAKSALGGISIGNEESGRGMKLAAQSALNRIDALAKENK